MCVLVFPTAFLRDISHSKKNSVMYDQKYVLVFMKIPSTLLNFNEI
jgi:hypothetical protein